MVADMKGASLRKWLASELLHAHLEALEMWQYDKVRVELRGTRVVYLGPVDGEEKHEPSS